MKMDADREYPSNPSGLPALQQRLSVDLCICDTSIVVHSFEGNSNVQSSFRGLKTLPLSPLGKHRNSIVRGRNLSCVPLSDSQAPA
jgi:hypothetical protein